MSSSNTQRAGKSSRDRGNKSPSATTQSLKSVTATDGHAKPPDGFIPKVQPTPEQIRLAQIINDPTKQDDPDIQNKVHQVMEVTGQSSDAVVIALHDCDNDPTRAITMLIEGNKQEGEWETRGKKKKPVKEGSSQQQQSLQKGDQGGGGGGGPGSSNKENRGGPRGEGGPRNTPRGSSGGTGGGGGRGRGGGGSWKSKEIEKNERNLEDGRPGDRGGDVRPRGGGRRGGRGGRGGGSVGGRGSRTFQNQNRGLGGEGFPQSMDTWSNSTSAAGQRPPRGQQQESMAVGTWNDLAASEDWSEEDWSGQLETKVFTASGVPANPPPAPDTASIMQLLKEAPPTPAAPATTREAAPAPQQQQQQPPCVSSAAAVAQFNQQATESIKAAVGVGSSSPASTLTNSGSYPSHSQPVAASPADAPVPSKPAPAPQRTKTPRVRVPPPSKIPESAVEMPEDSAVTSLDVQFGGIEFGTDTFDFGATDGPVPVSTSQPPSMPPGLGHGEQQAAAVPSSTPYLDGHPSVSKGGVSPPGVSGGPLGGSQQAAKDVSPSQQQQQQHQPSAGVPNAASLARPPGIPAPKEVVPGGLVPASAASANALASPASSSSPAAASSSPAGHGKGPSPSSSSGPMGASSDHLLLQAQAVSERSKSVSSSSVAGPQSKMYTSAAAAQRSSSQGALEGSGGGLSSSAAGKVEQPMYSSAGGHHYGAGAYQAGGANKSLVGSYLATHSQGFPSSTSAGGQQQQQQQQHYYPPQQTTSSAAVFSQQQSNGYQGPYQSNAYSSGPSQQQQQQASYGVSAKLSGSTGGLNPHSVKDSVLDSAASQQGAANQQHAYENSHVAATVGGLPSGPVATLATTASSLAGATATTSVLKNSMSATGKTMPTMPPGVPTAMLGHHQFLVGNAPAMPYYGLQQQPLYSYEELQMLQTRMPHLGYYDMQYPLPATSLAGRDLTLNNMAYAAEGKFGRAENSDSSPGTVAGVGGPQGGAAAGAAGGAPGAQQGAQQGAPPTAGQQAANQPFLNTLPPGYGYYFPSNIMPGSIHHYGPPPMFPVPPVTNAHGPTTSAQFQKANAYASHSFTSGGYDSLTPTPDYAKNTYGAGSQGQAKGISGSFF